MGALRVVLAAGWLSIWASTAEAGTQVRFGAFIIPGSPADVLFQDFADTVAAADVGLDLKLFIRGEVGPEQQVLSSLRRGRLQMATVSSITLAGVVPELGLIESPFLFASIDEAHFVVETELLPLIELKLLEKGLTLVRWLDLGMLGLFAKTPILTPDDMRGRRMRVSPSLASKYFFAAVQADSIFMSATEIVQGLQTNLVSGAENFIITYVGTGMELEAPHFTVTDHSYVTAQVLANRAWIEALPAPQRSVILSAFPGREATDRVGREMAERRAADGARAGVTFHELDADQRRVWTDSVVGVTDTIAAEVGGDAARFVAAIERGILRYRAGQ